MSDSVLSTGAERIATLRERVMTSKNAGDLARIRDTSVVDAASLRASEQESSWTIRRGLITRDRLATMRFDFDELEFFVGRLRAPEHAEADVEAAQAYLADYKLDFPGQTGHCELDLDRLMRLGIDGLAAEIEGHLPDDLSGSSKLPGRHGQGDTYRSFLLGLHGLSAMIEAAAGTVEAAIAGADPARQAGLHSLAAACRRIAHEPPTSYIEAIQLLWFVLIGVMNADRAWLVVPGHLDRTLGPFYEVDVARGRLTRDEALHLIEQLYIYVNAYVPDGLAMSVMVGGRDKLGNDVTNELSYLCLEAIRSTHMIYPTVGVCWHEGTPRLWSISRWT